MNSKEKKLHMNFFVIYELIFASIDEIYFEHQLLKAWELMKSGLYYFKTSVKPIEGARNCCTVQPTVPQRASKIPNAFGETIALNKHSISTAESLVFRWLMRTLGLLYLLLFHFFFDFQNMLIHTYVKFCSKT